MVVRELLTRLGFQVQEGDLRRYERGTNNIKRSAEGAADAFRNMFAAFVGVSAIRSLANVADTMQSLQSRVGLLPQTLGDVGTAFDTVAGRASAARQSIEAYTTLYTRIGHATKEYVQTQEGVLQITDTVSKALIVGGASAQESASVMLQLAQALGSGVLQGQEFNAMAEGAPQLLDALAVAMGHPRDQLKKLASEGKITTKDLITAFQAISSDFDSQFLQMPMTIGQATTLVQNRWAVFINRMNRESGAVTKIAAFFLDTFESIENGLDRLVDFFGGATNTLKFFGIALAAALAPLVLRLAAGAVAFLLSPLGLLIIALTFIGLLLEDFYQWMTGGESVIGSFIGSVDDVKKKMEEWSGTITALKIVATAAALVIGLHFAELALRMAAGAAMIAVGWIVAGIKIAAAGVAAMLPWLLVIGIVALIIAAIYGLWLAWQKYGDQIKAFGSKIWDSIVESFESMITKLKGYWTSFKEFFTGKVSTNVDVNGEPLQAPNRRSYQAAAANAAAANSERGGTSVVVNQTLPPGTPAETAAAASAATKQAIQDSGMARMSRQMGQQQ